MRFLLLFGLIVSSTLKTTCSSDDATAKWVLEAVKNRLNSINNTELDLTPTTGKFTSTQPTVEINPVTPKLNLTPVAQDTTVYCMVRDNIPGICILYYQCNSETKTVIEDGVGLLDLRSQKCPHYLEVCCKTNDIQTDTPSVPTQGNNEGNDAELDQSPNRNKEQETSSPSTFITQRPIKPIADVVKKSNIPQCGWSNPGVSPFVFRSTDTAKNYPQALYGDFPWMVAILKRSGNSNVWSQADYFGGGTLIHPSVVMTVAHRLGIKQNNYTTFQPNELKCRAGEWDTQTELELYPHQERNVAKIIEHDKFYRVSAFNDIALLILEKPFTMKNAPHIGLGCIASSLPPPGRVCYSMGWGIFDPTDKRKYANILKKVLLQTVDHDTCQDLLRTNSRLGALFQLHESLTCASGSPETDTCRGDGGAPLVCAVSDNPGEMRFAVYGMVAYGLKCFDPNVPGVYANTVTLKPWIDATMQKENLDTKYYTM